MINISNRWNRPTVRRLRATCWLAMFGGMLAGTLAGMATGLPGSNAIAQPPVATSRVGDVLERLARANDGHAKLRGEYQRLDGRIVETQGKILQSQQAIVRLNALGMQISNQLESLQNEMNRQQLTPSGPGGPGGGPRRPGPTRAGNGGGNRNQNQNAAITNLSNQLTRIQVSLREEQMRLVVLNTDLNQATVRRETIRRDGMKHVEEFWKLADPFGRLGADEQRQVIAATSALIDADADQVGARLVRGIAYRHVGQLAEADADLTRVAETPSPLQAVALAARAELRFAQGNETQGKADIGKATSATKQRPESRVQLYRGWILCGQEKFDAAQTEFVKGLRLGGMDADAHRLLALLSATTSPARSTAKDVQDAVDHGKRACELTKSQDWLSLDALAAAQAAAGDFEAAIDNARLAVNLSPADRRAQCEQRIALFTAKQRLTLDWPATIRGDGPVAGNP